MIGRAVLHIHQGGTTNTYCGQPLEFGCAVSWEDARRATCSGCRSHFA